MRRHIFSLLICLITLLIITGCVQLLDDTALKSPTVISVTPLASGNIRPNLERGMADVVWTSDGYNTTSYQQSLKDIYQQSGANWLSLQVVFAQSNNTSTIIKSGTPSLASFTEGVQFAKHMGYHLFFEPIMTVVQPSYHWGGSIHPQDESLWFKNYFAALKSYILIAQQEGIEQFAIGTELEWMQNNAPASLWNQLIAQVRAIFSGELVYDANWNIVDVPVNHLPSWFRNPGLSAFGVTVYVPLVQTSSTPITTKNAQSLWTTKIRQPLDVLSVTLKKPIVLAEFGYRNTRDAAYLPWIPVSALPADSSQQSILFNAALPIILSDTHILGVFLWSWDNAKRFSLKDQISVQIIHKWYVE